MTKQKVARLSGHCSGGEGVIGLWRVRLWVENLQPLSSTEGWRESEKGIKLKSSAMVAGGGVKPGRD